MKKFLIVTIVLALTAGVWFAFRGGRSSEPAGDENGTRIRRIAAAGESSLAREKIDAAAAAMTNGEARTGRSARRLRISAGRDDESLWTFEDGTPWPEAQKELMRAISSAADGDDFNAVVKLSAEVAACENAELRERFVEELGWFGEKAFVELANFISDPNEDVADAARTQIADAFQEIDSDAEKAALFALMAKAISDNDLLDTFADELTTMDEVLALQTIVDTISEGTPKAKAKVKEAYETITDEKWKNVDAAETWLAENYDDDDSSEAAEQSKPEKAATCKKASRGERRRKANANAAATEIDGANEPAETDGALESDVADEGEDAEEFDGDFDGEDMDAETSDDDETDEYITETEDGIGGEVGATADAPQAPPSTN